MSDYQEKIDELRAVDRDGSNEFAIQVTIVGICIFVAWYVTGLWQLVVWYVALYGLTAFERYLHRRTPQIYSRATHITYLVIGTTIAVIASLLPIYLWTFDAWIFHFAAMIYTLGAVLNTFILRARAWPALLCYAIPNALGIITVAVMFFLKDGSNSYTIVGIILAMAISSYLVVMVRESERRVRYNRDTTKALLQAQKSETVANFAGGVAHDFNNLLSVILASLEQAKGEKDEKERRALIHQAVLAVERGAGLTKQLLAVGRQSELETNPIDMQSFADELQQFLLRIIPSSIKLEVSCDPKLKTLNSEPSLLQSMLLNLALNARDALSEAGTLRITIQKCAFNTKQRMSQGDLPPGVYAEFSVIDNGKGIPSEVFGRVLEPFYSTRPNGEGTGLGLAMVTGFSQQMGGALNLTSRPGVGTTVRFYLPISEAGTHQTGQGTSPAGAAATPKPQGLKVLLVEDETVLNQMLKRYLSKQGFSVRAFENGDLAYHAVQRGYQADIVLTDIVMPGTRQGTDLVTELRAILPNASMILMSGYSFSHDVSAYADPEKGNTFFIEKPFKLGDLDTLLRKVMRSTHT